MKRCIEKHTCDTCINYAKIQKEINKSFLFCYFKAYDNEEKSTYENLIMPYEFYEYIKA